MRREAAAGMAAIQISRLHSCSVPAQCNLVIGGRLSKALCYVPSSSSLRRGAWLSNSSLIKVGSSVRLCSPVTAASSLSAANLGDGEGDGASSMEWLSPTSGNPMEEWLRKGDEREGDAWREECGVVAIFGDPEASRLCYLSLHAMQHRGQEGAGIVTANEHTLHAVTGNELCTSSAYSVSPFFCFGSVHVGKWNCITLLNLGWFIVVLIYCDLRDDSRDGPRE